MKRNTGFTIIELLVVITIIGIVAAAALALLSNARDKSRDSRRVEDVRQIQNALNLFAADNRNNFPSAGVGSPSSWAVVDGTTDVLSTALVSGGHAPAIPTDPLHDGVNYYYRYRSYGGTASVGSATANGYDVEFCLETESIQGYSSGCGNIVSP